MVMGMRGIRPELERWQLDVDGVRNRMYLAPTPRERERWHALWLLCRGLTASATAEALGRDAHTIGRWATAFNEGGPAALIFEQSGGSPRAESGAAGGVEGCGAEDSGNGGDRTGQLELEDGAAVCLGALRRLAEPQHLLGLSAPLGIRVPAPQETAAQGG